MESQRNREKRAAAVAATREVHDGMRLGLGSGSTALHAVRALGERVARGLEIVGVPTSRETARVAREVGIVLDDLEDDPHLDLTIDGADEVDGALRLIKGGGGALLREKIVASATDRVLIVADASKRVDRLGAFPLPVEVVPFAATLVAARIRDRFDVPCRLRTAPGGGIFVTDEGNCILDCPFGAIEDPEGLADALASLPGVVEHGLFLDLANEVIVAVGDDVQRIVAAEACSG
ncbi:MAG: ribose-5-phosphate isomerase RpiA [Planctomycetota bacterium]